MAYNRIAKWHLEHAKLPDKLLLMSRAAAGSAINVKVLFLAYLRRGSRGGHLFAFWKEKKTHINKSREKTQVGMMVIIAVAGHLLARDHLQSGGLMECCIGNAVIMWREQRINVETPGLLGRDEDDLNSIRR